MRIICIKMHESKKRLTLNISVVYRRHALKDPIETPFKSFSNVGMK